MVYFIHLTSPLVLRDKEANLKLMNPVEEIIVLEFVTMCDDDDLWTQRLNIFIMKQIK